MSLENQDWLSAASDNQPLSKAQLDRLLAEPELQDKLERYQLIGAALRGEQIAPLSRDFSGDFARLLQDETEYNLTPSSNILHRLGRGIKHAANGRWLQPVAQGAIAAGVALMAVFGVQQYQQPGASDVLSPLPVLQTQPVAGFYTPVSLSQTTVEDRFAEQQQQAMLEQQKRLQALLNAHRQQVRVMEQAQQTKQRSDNTVDNTER